MKAFRLPERTGPQRILIASLVVLLCTQIAAHAESNAAASRPTVWDFNSTIPLGTDLLLLKPSKESVAVMVSAESEEFKRWRLLQNSEKRIVIDPDGQPIKKMPSRIAFRITAGTKDKLADTTAYPVEADTDLNNFLLRLRFRAKIFRGVESRTVEPEQVKMIGVPAEEPYNERIFKVRFDLGDVNIDDRVVLEIFDGNGEERISKFHLEF